MLSGSEKYYDEIYGAMEKEYAAEAVQIHEIIQKNKRTNGNFLLDVACGTGAHAGFLGKYYEVEGVDINMNMLKIARKKHPGIHFLQGDMRTLDLGRQFDAVTCLFSAIGYVKTETDLHKAVKAMSRHLLPGGVLVIEPWFTPEQWYAGRVSTILVEKPDVKIVRMSRSRVRGRISTLEFHYLIGTAKGIEHFVEIHELGLFSHEDYLQAFTRAGLDVTHDPEGIDKRGLYIGTKSMDRQ